MVSFNGRSVDVRPVVERLADGNYTVVEVPTGHAVRVRVVDRSSEGDRQRRADVDAAVLAAGAKQAALMAGGLA